VSIIVELSITIVLDRIIDTSLFDYLSNRMLSHDVFFSCQSNTHRNPFDVKHIDAVKRFIFVCY
jgi:hypothetical protein